MFDPVVQMMKKIRVISFAPEIIVFTIGIFLALHGAAPLSNDALEYETLSRSILHGEYALEAGVPSMFREPGYPLFRAFVYSVGGSWDTVLYIQAIFAALTVYLWRKIWQMFDTKYAWIGACGTLLAYGYWMRAGRSGYEILLGSLLAWGVFCALRFSQSARPSWAVLSGLTLGFLSLTRGVFLFLPFVFVILFVAQKGWKTSFVHSAFRKGCLAFLALSFLVPGIWMVRNERQFYVLSLASRPGIVLYARAVTAKMGWDTWESSFVSVFVGTGLERLMFPSSAEPLEYQHYALMWTQYDHDLNVTHQDRQAADSLMFQEAKEIIFSNPQTFVRYIAWTGIEELRLFGLPSPRSLDVSVEPIYAHLPLRLWSWQVAFLIFVALLEWIWWVGGAVGLYLAFRRFGPSFLIGIPVLYLFSIHAPIDNVTRFSSSVQPIIGSAILFAGAWIVERYRSKKGHLAR